MRGKTLFTLFHHVDPSENSPQSFILGPGGAERYCSIPPPLLTTTDEHQILHLKHLIQQQQHYPVEHQKIIYSGNTYLLPIIPSDHSHRQDTQRSHYCTRSRHQRGQRVLRGHGIKGTRHLFIHLESHLPLSPRSLPLQHHPRSPPPPLPLSLPLLPSPLTLLLPSPPQPHHHPNRTMPLRSSSAPNWRPRFMR